MSHWAQFGEQDADPGPFADAGGQQGVGQLERRGVSLGESQSLVVGDEELAVGLRAPPRQQLGDAGRQPLGRRSSDAVRRRGHQPTWTGICE